MGFSIPDFSEIQSIPGLVEALFDLSLWFLGIAIFIQIIRAGYKRFFAFGNPGKASESNQMISGAFIGAILLVSSVMILKTINPDLVKTSVDLSTFRSASLQITGICNLYTKEIKSELTRLASDCDCQVLCTDEDIIQVEGQDVALAKVQTHAQEPLIEYIVSELNHVRYFNVTDRNNFGAREFSAGNFTYILYSHEWHPNTDGFFDFSEDCSDNDDEFDDVDWIGRDCAEQVSEDKFSYLEIRFPFEGGDAVNPDEFATRTPSPVAVDPQGALEETGIIIGPDANILGMTEEEVAVLIQLRDDLSSISHTSTFTVIRYESEPPPRANKIIIEFENSTHNGFFKRALDKYKHKEPGNVYYTDPPDPNKAEVRYRETSPNIWEVVFPK